MRMFKTLRSSYCFRGMFVKFSGQIYVQKFKLFFIKMWILLAPLLVFCLMLFPMRVGKYRLQIPNTKQRSWFYRLDVFSYHLISQRKSALTQMALMEIPRGFNQNGIAKKTKYHSDTYNETSTLSFQPKFPLLFENYLIFVKIFLVFTLTVAAPEFFFTDYHPLVKAIV